jgi:hypothetical protein
VEGVFEVDGITQNDFDENPEMQTLLVDAVADITGLTSDKISVEWLWDEEEDQYNVEFEAAFKSKQAAEMAIANWEARQGDAMVEMIALIGDLNGEAEVKMGYPILQESAVADPDSSSFFTIPIIGAIAAAGVLFIFGGAFYLVRKKPKKPFSQRAAGGGKMHAELDIIPYAVDRNKAYMHASPRASDPVKMDIEFGAPPGVDVQLGENMNAYEMELTLGDGDTFDIDGDKETSII